MSILDYIKRLLSEKYDFKKIREELNLLKELEDEWHIRYRRYRNSFRSRYELELEKIKRSATSKIHTTKGISELEEKVTNNTEPINVRYVIVSQGVGTFYTSSREGVSYIKEGDEISIGTLVGRIESQKIEHEVLFSPAKSGKKGNTFKIIKSNGEEEYKEAYFEKATVERILVEDGYPVDYNCKLIEILPIEKL